MSRCHVVTLPGGKAIPPGDLKMWYKKKRHVIARTALIVSPSDIEIAYELLLAYIDIDGSTRKVPALAYLVFEEALVGFLHILRQVGEEHE